MGKCRKDLWVSVGRICNYFLATGMSKAGQVPLLNVNTQCINCQPP
jgi:hypothetical protein